MDELTQGRPAAGRTDRSKKRSQRAFNSIARAVLGSPVHWLMSKNLMVIEVTGRRTGTVYAVPTAYADHDGQVLAASAGTWVRNLAADRPVTLVHRGRRRAMLSEVATERSRSVQIAAALLPSNPILRGNLDVQLGADGLPEHAQLDAALARGVRFIAFHPNAA